VVIDDKILISAICGLALFVAYLVRYMVLSVADKLERVSIMLDKITEVLTELCASNGNTHREQLTVLNNILKVLLKINNNNNKKTGGEK